jgi:hypothetical protein
MTTQTIPEYLEEERQKTADTQLQVEKEAARIEPLQHGHHRNSKQSKPKLELVPPFRTVTRKKAKSKKKTQAKKKKSTAVVVRRKPRVVGEKAKKRKRA